MVLDFDRTVEAGLIVDRVQLRYSEEVFHRFFVVFVRFNCLSGLLLIMLHLSHY